MPCYKGTLRCIYFQHSLIVSRRQAAPELLCDKVCSLLFLRASLQLEAFCAARLRTQPLPHESLLP